VLSRNLGTLTYWNPQGLSRPVMGLLYLYLYHTMISIPQIMKNWIGGGGVHVFWWGDLRERSQHKREVNIKMDLLELG